MHGMATDVYQPCPYCTDKKIKFCCADIAEEMAKVVRLSENGQHRAAIKILDKLAVTHPRTVWNEATRAMILMQQEEPERAKDILQNLHEAEPENQAVIALLAAAAFAADGYAPARDAIWRAFRKATTQTELVTSIAVGIADEMWDNRKYLSARQHLTLAMRLAPSRNKESIFVRLLDFDGDTTIPYPLRSVHSLRDISGDDERQNTARKAMRLAERGCFGQAAERFAALAQQTPEDPAVEYNFALCKAWEADEEVAAEAFGRAALAENDFELAAEYAALEQLLRANLDDRVLQKKTIHYEIDSAAKLIGDLEAHPRCQRVSLPPSSAFKERFLPDAAFTLLDRPLPESIDGLAIDDLPRVIGRLFIVASSENVQRPIALLSTFEGSNTEAAKSLLNEQPGLQQRDEQLDDSRSAIPCELAPLHSPLALPDQIPANERRKLEKARWESAIETWLNSPQEALIGKSPLAAAQDERLRVPLAGALHVLDAFCLQFSYTVDLDGLRRRLGLPETTPLEVRPDLPLNGLSALQLHRLKVADLDDRQLAVVLNRALLVRHARFLKIVLEEALKRDLPEVHKDQLFVTLSDLARNEGDIPTALHWIEEGRKNVQPGEHHFEQIYRWDTHELSIRLEDPRSPDLQPFIRRLLSYYGPKLPKFKEYLAIMLNVVGIPMPDVLEPAGATSAGGLWTPDQSSPATEKKLWLPGI
jgi:thioredoxin-like negative regulator of GroEL